MDLSLSLVPLTLTSLRQLSSTTSEVYASWHKDGLELKRVFKFLNEADLEQRVMSLELVLRELDGVAASLPSIYHMVESVRTACAQLDASLGRLHALLQQRAHSLWLFRTYRFHDGITQALDDVQRDASRLDKRSQLLFHTLQIRHVLRAPSPQPSCGAATEEEWTPCGP